MNPIRGSNQVDRYGAFFQETNLTGIKWLAKVSGAAEKPTLSWNSSKTQTKIKELTSKKNRMKYKRKNIHKTYHSNASHASKKYKFSYKTRVTLISNLFTKTLQWQIKKTCLPKSQNQWSKSQKLPLTNQEKYIWTPKWTMTDKEMHSNCLQPNSRDPSTCFSFCISLSEVFPSIFNLNIFLTFPL